MNYKIFLWFYLILVPALFITRAQATPSDWTAEIDNLTKDDVVRPPAPHGIVFVGSSSIRNWETLNQDFPGLPVIRRGFGGSGLADSVYFLDRLVLPYHPDIVVLYAGENDIFAGKTPEAVTADFRNFCSTVQAKLPAARIIYLAMKPSPSRWKFHKRMQAGNAMIAAECAHTSGLTFVDVYTPMLGPDGMPRSELFRKDMLHMNHDGYVIWARLLMPLLKP